MLRAKIQREGKLDTEIDDVLKDKESVKQSEIRDECKQTILASLGELAKPDQIVNRLVRSPSIGQDDDETGKISQHSRINCWL